MAIREHDVTLVEDAPFVPAHAVEFCRRHGVEADLQDALRLALEFFPDAHSPVFRWLRDGDDEWLSIRFAVPRHMAPEAWLRTYNRYTRVWSDTAPDRALERIVISFDRIS